MWPPAGEYATENTGVDILWTPQPAVAQSYPCLQTRPDFHLVTICCQSLPSALPAQRKQLPTQAHGLLEPLQHVSFFLPNITRL